jgi:hypothetical protein
MVAFYYFLITNRIFLWATISPSSTPAVSLPIKPLTRPAAARLICQTASAMPNIMPLFAVALCVGTSRVGGNPMTLIMAEDEVLSAAIAGVPKVAELIAAVPTEDRSRALEAAEMSYLRTALTLDYQDAEAQQ